MKRSEKEEIIVDSRLSFAEAIAGTEAPGDVMEELCLLTVSYYSFDDRLHRGQLVVHRDVREEVRSIFELVRITRFPLGKVIPVVRYGWSDEDSMADNNTSAFNYRYIAGTTRLSRHAHGRAVDVNPRQNPVVYADGRILPAGAVYEPRERGALAGGIVLEAFLSRGWHWGGNFGNLKDYHHFEK